MSIPVADWVPVIGPSSAMRPGRGGEVRGDAEAIEDEHPKTIAMVKVMTVRNASLVSKTVCRN